jgi:transcriptional regulator with XRE-family HTH domain
MLTRDQLAAALGDRNIQEVARQTGVHFNTLHKIKAGRVTPSKQVATRLSQYLTTPAWEWRGTGDTT